MLVVFAGGVEEPAHGLVGRRLAHVEGGVVCGHHGAGAHASEHVPGFFGGCMAVAPAFVGADAEHGEIDVLEFVEGVGGGGVAGEEHAGMAGVDEVGVVSAPPIEGVAGAPVIGFERGDGESADAERAMPREFDDSSEAVGEKVPGSRGGDDGGAGVRECFECGEVEMIEVRVGEEDEVEAAEGVGLEGRILETGGSDGSPDDAGSDPSGEDRVSEERGVAGADEACGVAEPCGGEAFGGREDVWGRGRLGLRLVGGVGVAGGFAEGLGDLARVSAELGADGQGPFAESFSQWSRHARAPWTP